MFSSHIFELYINLLGVSCQSGCSFSEAISGSPFKGNCDAELVLQAMIDLDTYEKGVLVTGDGDFFCLVDYLIKQKKLKKLLIPNQKKYSALLKSIPSEFLAFVSDLKEKVSFKQKKTS